MAKGIQFIFLLLMLLGNQTSFSQNFTFNFRHLTVDDGLQGRRVNSIVEDKEGFIWIATNEGLSRFDGYEFKHFTKEKDGLVTEKK